MVHSRVVYSDDSVEFAEYLLFPPEFDDFGTALPSVAAAACAWASPAYEIACGGMELAK